MNATPMVNSMQARADGRRAGIDAATIMRIRNLQLRAKVVVEGFFNGLHRSPFHGFSAEFSEYRQYTPGDDTRFIDWRLFARTDRYHIKRFEDETNRRCLLVTDLSQSMAYGSLGYSKLEYSRTLAATLAYYLSLQRDPVGMLTFDEAVCDYLPPRFRPGQLRNLMTLLERATAGKRTGMVAALEQIATVARKRGLIVLLSDFLHPAEALRRPLSYLRSRGHELVAFRILDPTEVDFDFDEAANFVDLENGRPMFIDPQAARDDYLARFQAHAQELANVCAQLGVTLSTFKTNDALDLALFKWLAYESRQTAVGAITRRGGQGGRR